jgi:hypothetical protein
MYRINIFLLANTCEKLHNILGQQRLLSNIPRCRCKCGAALCSSSLNCAAGKFCDVLSSTCKPCHECSTDANVANGACADACPFGPTDALAPALTSQPRLAMNFNYFAFTSRDLFTFFRGLQARALSACCKWTRAALLDPTRYVSSVVYQPCICM